MPRTAAKHRAPARTIPLRAVPSHVPTPHEMVAAARKLIPALRERALATERNRELLPETIADLKRAGIHKLFTPRRYGGFEMDWGVHVDVSRELGRGCGSTAWVASVVYCHTWLLARFPAECQEEFWPSHPDAVIGTAFAGGGAMRKVKGGYILNGRWRFSSGINHADCAVVAAAVGEHDPHSGRQQVFRMAMLLPSDYTVIDVWHAEGLRGTGSNDIEVKEKFIPEHRTILTAAATGREPPGAKLHASYIYRVEFAPYFFTLLAGPLLGTAIGAFEEYCAITKTRVGAMYRESVAEQVPVQVRVGESAAELQAARLLVDNISRGLHEVGAAGRALSGTALLSIRRDLALAAKLCVRSAGRLAGMMGVSGQIGHNPVHRQVRDCRTIASHGGVQWDASLGPIGKLMLGLKTGDAKVDQDADRLSPAADPALS
jgi:3-hydroxy-9,10-secoandrosta-1,3,5(10)-triene-9,17-dione monooxygenase